MAEVVALQPERVFKLPDSVSFEAGAGLLFNDLTVHFALRERGRLQTGETVLVHGAAGGIGGLTLTAGAGLRGGPRHRGGRRRGQVDVGGKPSAPATWLLPRVPRTPSTC